MLNLTKIHCVDVAEIELSNAQDWLIDEPEQIVAIEEIFSAEVDSWH